MTCHIKKVLEMKKTYRFISFVLSMVMMFSLVISASAAGAVQNVPQKITWNDLPEAYKQVIEPDAVIYKNSDGTFDIYKKMRFREACKDHLKDTNLMVEHIQIFQKHPTVAQKWCSSCIKHLCLMIQLENIWYRIKQLC